MYFLGQWVIARLDIPKPGWGLKPGDPVRFAWIYIMGTLVCALIGSYLFMIMFIVNIKLTRLSAAALLSFFPLSCCIWTGLFSVIAWHYTGPAPPPDVDSRLASSRPMLSFSIPFFISLGGVAFFVLLSDEPAAGIALCASLFFLLFGFGAYTSFHADYLPLARNLERDKD
jgi:hypothetical protein